MKRKHGWGEGWLVEPSKKNGYKFYVACWKFKGRLHKRSTGTANRTEADEKLKSFVAEFAALRERDFTAATNRAIEREQKKINALEDGERTLAMRDAFDAVSLVAKGKVAEATLDCYRTACGDFCQWLTRNRKPQGADIEMREIGAKTVKDWLAAKAEKHVAPQTRLRLASVLKAIFKRICEAEDERVHDAASAGRRRAGDLPWARLDLAEDKWWSRALDVGALDGENEERQSVARRPLTREELRRLLEAAKPGEKWLLFRIGAQFGLRMGDAATLRFGVNVRLDEGETGRLRVIPAKTGRRSKSYIDTALGRELHDYLAALPQSKANGAYLMPKLAASYTASASNVSVVVRSVFAKAGFEGAATVGSCVRRRAVYGFHSLRMTLAKVMANADLDAAARALGHSRAGGTTRGYLNGEKSVEEREAEAKAWELWFNGGDKKTAKTPANAFAVRAGEVGRAEVADAQKPVFDAVCAMLANLESETLRAVASEALRLAMANAIKAGKKAVAS